MTRQDRRSEAVRTHHGSGDAVMPGRGRLVARDYIPAELTVLGATISVLGETTYDIYLDDRAYWLNVPADVWNYRQGGYQALKQKGSPTVSSAS
ncbi:MAG: hypothetical protein OXI91_14035 [Chloroflexota bacterium]|nr:hypothetical protein [Chloroflexota bacterium]